MADEKPIERTYNVPLRKEFLKVPKHKRAKKAVAALKQFVVKHMKSENIKIGYYVNQEIWKRGIKSPPHHVKINVTKDKEGLVNVELVGAPVEEKKEDTKDSKKEEIKPTEKDISEKTETKPTKKEISKKEVTKEEIEIKKAIKKVTTSEKTETKSKETKKHE